MIRAETMAAAKVGPREEWEDDAYDECFERAFGTLGAFGPMDVMMGKTAEGAWHAATIANVRGGTCSCLEKGPDPRGFVELARVRLTVEVQP